MKTIRYLRYGPCSSDTVQIPRPGLSKWWEWSHNEAKWHSLGRLGLVHVRMNITSPEDASEAVQRVIAGSEGHLLVIWEDAPDGNVVWGSVRSDRDAFTTGVTATPSWLKLPSTVWDRLLESDTL